jgi:hypothetical protein
MNAVELMDFTIVLADGMLRMANENEIKAGHAVSQFAGSIQRAVKSGNCTTMQKSWEKMPLYLQLDVAKLAESCLSLENLQWLREAVKTWPAVEAKKLPPDPMW